VSATVADARDLPMPDECADAVLLLGPLYHLTNRADRLSALREGLRIARPQALIAVAAIARYSALLAFAVDGVLTDDDLAALRDEIRTGEHSAGLGFTDAHMHSPDELVAELEEVGVRDVVLYGVEGPLWTAARLLPVDAELSQYVTVARELEQEPSAWQLSSHLLAVGRA
jgi:ubiquinone/menaquinone biosynthesis C-methylase UbiE